MSALLDIADLDAGYGKCAVLRGVSMRLDQREILGIVGPNGCGKSTLVKTIAGVLPKLGGRVTVCAEDSESLSREEMARRLSVVPQQHGLLFSFTVSEMVEMGRYPHKGSLSPLTGEDRQIIDAAIRDADLEALIHREADHLSGGEIQRMFIARALAQQTPIVLLDEPNTHLDLAHQEQVFSVLRKLADGGRSGVVCVLHDMNLASEFCDRIVMIGEGAVVASGTPAEVFTAANIKRHYGAQVRVESNPVSGRPLIISEHALSGGAR